MSESRFQALTDVLLRQGYLGPVLTIGYVPPASVAVFWVVPEDDPGRVAAQAIIDSWPWADDGEHPLEVQGKIMAAGVRLQTSEPTADAARVALRHLWDHVNDVREHVGLARVKEPQIMAELAAYLGNGLSLPGLRPDLDSLLGGGDS